MSKVELTKSQKAELLSILALDVQISGKRSPLMIAVGQSAIGTLLETINPTSEWDLLF